MFGTSEQLINLKIVLKLQNLLEQSGTNVILTRSDEKGIYSEKSNSIFEKKVSDIKNRVQIVNNSGANLLVSIHLNKYPQSSIYRGWQTFYNNNNEDNIKIAEILQESLNENIEYNNTRNCKNISGIYLLDNITIPSCIVECGFLSNEEETKLLKSEDYQNKISWGIYLGIIKYFKECDKDGN